MTDFTLEVLRNVPILYTTYKKMTDVLEKLLTLTSRKVDQQVVSDICTCFGIYIYKFAYVFDLVYVTVCSLFYICLYLPVMYLEKFLKSLKSQSFSFV